MTTPAADTPEPTVALACRATVYRLQLVLDGERDAATLAADPHPSSCPACRERVAAARLLLSVLAAPEPVQVPAGMADAILAAVREDRHARVRRRAYAGSVGLVAALAASVLLVGWLTSPPPQPAVPWLPRVPDVAVAGPETAPEPRPAAEPQPKPMRIGDEFAKAGVALMGTPRSITEPAAAGSEVFSKLSDALTRPVAPVDDMGPARTALADLPDVARVGFEPVTGTAQKAFTRLLHDVGSVNLKPPS